MQVLGALGSSASQPHPLPSSCSKTAPVAAMPVKHWLCSARPMAVGLPCIATRTPDGILPPGGRVLTLLLYSALVLSVAMLCWAMAVDEFLNVPAPFPVPWCRQSGLPDSYHGNGALFAYLLQVQGASLLAWGPLQALRLPLWVVSRSLVLPGTHGGLRACASSVCPRLTLAASSPLKSHTQELLRVKAAPRSLSIQVTGSRGQGGHSREVSWTPVLHE